jgi:hypothetical protein
MYMRNYYGCTQYPWTKYPMENPKIKNKKPHTNKNKGQAGKQVNTTQKTSNLTTQPQKDESKTLRDT